MEVDKPPADILRTGWKASDFETIDDFAASVLITLWHGAEQEKRMETEIETLKTRVKALEKEKAENDDYSTTLLVQVNDHESTIAGLNEQLASAGALPAGTAALPGSSISVALPVDSPKAISVSSCPLLPSQPALAVGLTSSLVPSSDSLADLLAEPNHLFRHLRSPRVLPAHNPSDLSPYLHLIVDLKAPGGPKWVEQTWLAVPALRREPAIRETKRSVETLPDGSERVVSTRVLETLAASERVRVDDLVRSLYAIPSVPGIIAQGDVKPSTLR